MAGSGVLHVDTAPLFTPGAPYQVGSSGVLVADAGGRLHFDVDLGPSHQTQQYLFGSQPEASFAHTHIRIRPH